MSAYIVICALHYYIRGRNVSRDLLLLLEGWNFGEIPPPPLKVIFSSSSSFQRKKTNDIHVSNIKLLIIRTLIISHFKFDCVSHGHRYAYVKNDISVHYFNRGATQKVTTCFFQQTLILFCTRFWCFHILLKDYQILRYHHLFLF